jgi:tRNA-Thr(GGU) m(6)t(6)A37 methyltransferase TsaA
MSKSTERIILKPVGVVHTDVSDSQIKEENREAEAIVEILPEFEEALDGLEGYSHLFIVSFLHKLIPNQSGTLRVKPKRATRRGFKLEELPTLGVFALDSPIRPNPIGVSLVRLLRRQQRNLFIKGTDLFDGTPVLDIKPYHADYQIAKYTVPQWYLKIMDKNGHV